MVILYYINNEHKPQKTFAGNRVATIKTHTNPKQRFHVKSEDNIWDMACLGVGCCIFLECEQWKAGHDLRRKSTIDEEQDCVSEHDLLLSKPELKKSAISYATSSINSANTQIYHFLLRSGVPFLVGPN